MREVEDLIRQEQLFVHLGTCAFLCGPCANKTTKKQQIHRRHHPMGTVPQWPFVNLCIRIRAKEITALGCDFVGEYTNTQINKSPFFVSANVFSFAHRLMRICFVRKVVLLVNTQIHITK